MMVSVNVGFLYVAVLTFVRVLCGDVKMKAHIHRHHLPLHLQPPHTPRIRSSQITIQ